MKTIDLLKMYNTTLSVPLSENETNLRMYLIIHLALLTSYRNRFLKFSFFDNDKISYHKKTETLLDHACSVYNYASDPNLKANYSKTLRATLLDCMRQLAIYWNRFHWFKFDWNDEGTKVSVHEIADTTLLMGVSYYNTPKATIRLNDHLWEGKISYTLDLIPEKKKKKTVKATSKKKVIN